MSSHSVSSSVQHINAAEANVQKKLLGQFYTTTNPFLNQLFLEWKNKIPQDVRNGRWLEPFAGANNIVRMLDELGNKPEWSCFDLHPGTINAAPRFPIQQRDTLADFPSEFAVAITNPPYLARNSATRDGLAFPTCVYDDIYKYALSVMLDNVGYVAAIIPDSFLTSGLFHDRLYGVASLPCRMFDDTECPVCLAMFVPATVKNGSLDFAYYKGNQEIGSYSALKAAKNKLVQASSQIDWRFNERGGTIGLYAIDSPKGRTIRFVPGRDIEDAKIKVSSRSITKIAGVPRGVRSSALIDAANDLLTTFRDATSDVFLTPFKGMCADGDFRRRLDFAQARTLLNASVDQVRGVCRV